MICLFILPLPFLTAETEAENKFIEALQSEPANAQYHFELANLYASRHDRLEELSAYEESQRMLQLAASHLEQATMLKPDFIAAQYNLGVVYKGVGRYEDSRKQFQKVLQLDPQSANAQMQIGAVYERQGFFDEAEDAYKRAKEMDFYNPDIQSALEDLEMHRHADHERMVAESEPRGFGRLREGFNYSSFSQAQNLEADRQAGQAGQGLQQVMPYLGAMLVQQFMKGRNKEE